MSSATERSPLVTIKPSQSWITLDLKSLLAYRDLLVILVQRDFTAKYKQTALGPIWFFINPLITTVVFTLIFSQVIGVSTDGIPPLLFYMAGNLGWGYFSTVLGSTSNSLAGNAGLFSKVYFPRLIPPLALTLSGLFALSIQLLTFFGFYLKYLLYPAAGFTVAGPSLTWLLFPVLIAHMAILGLGVGLCLSALTAKYRDFQHLQGFLVNIWMYATPIIYPMSRIPEAYRWLASINPMSAVVETMRFIFLGAGHFSLPSYLLSFGLSVVLLLIGLFAYQRSARTFVDTV